MRLTVTVAFQSKKQHSERLIFFRGLSQGKFYGGHDGSEGAREPEFYPLPNTFIRQHHDATTSWQKVRLKNLEKEIEPYAGKSGFEQIARASGIPKPVKQKSKSTI